MQGILSIPSDIAQYYNNIYYNNNNNCNYSRYNYSFCWTTGLLVRYISHTYIRIRISVRVLKNVKSMNELLSPCETTQNDLAVKMKIKEETLGQTSWSFRVTRKFQRNDYFLVCLTGEKRVVRTWWLKDMFTMKERKVHHRFVQRWVNPEDILMCGTRMRPMAISCLRTTIAYVTSCQNSVMLNLILFTTLRNVSFFIFLQECPRS